MSQIFTILRMPLLATALMLLFVISGSVTIGQNTTPALHAAQLQEQNVDLVPLQNIKQIVAGDQHTCALTTTGRVKCWGHNYDGQLGDGTTQDRMLPVDVVGLDNEVTAIAAANRHTCALKIGGSVTCWGNNIVGQLGNGTTVNSTKPIDVIGLDGVVKSIAASDDETCVLLEVGGVKCWGENYIGQLGDGTTIDRSTPVDVINLNGTAKSIAVGGEFACVLLLDGGTKCWGNNSNGRLGDGTTTSRTTPSAVSGIGNDVTAISAGGAFACALLNTNDLKCWGSNNFGELGDGTIENRLTPVSVTSLGGSVRSFANGWNHSCAVYTDGSLACWGKNELGQLGDGSTTDHPTPADVTGLNSDILSITAGSNHTCALLSSGSVKCWGQNGYGQLGNGASWHTTPTNVTGINTGGNVIATSHLHTCSIVQGAVLCWGENSSGQLGNGTFRNNATPISVTGLNSNTKSIAVGWGHSCALLNNGGLKCWGNNLNGQLGNGGGSGSYTIPISVTNLSSGVSDVVAGSGHSCALVGTSVKCWGNNYFGQLGDGTTENRFSPVDVNGLSEEVLAIAAGIDHTCALTSNGFVKCWGRNGGGQLGGGPGSDQHLPVTVQYFGQAFGDNIIALGAGYYHTCALLDSGDVKCWGGNFAGQLGDGTTSEQSIPVNVIGLGSNVSAISVGYYHTCALKNNGSVSCWGSNRFGSLGDGYTTDRTIPVDVTGLSNGVAKISAGNDYTCAILNDGRVQCWGANDYGQLGDGTAWQTTPVTVLQEAKPDLVITDIVIQEVGSPTCRDKPYNLPKVAKVTVSNDGTSASNAFVVSLNNNISQTVSAGLAVSAMIVMEFSSGFQNGDNTAIVDANNTVVESIEDNNALTKSIIMPANTPIPTCTPTRTPTPTFTRTHTRTPTPTHTPPLRPSDTGDAYENDDTCVAAHTISTDGSVQTRTFHKNADTDWVRFDAVAGEEYMIDINIPVDSLADVTLEMYPACGNLSLGGQDYSFSPTVRLQWKAETSGPVNLKLSHNDAGVFGAKISYELSVRSSDANATPGALILVAGAIKNNDTVQPNIYGVTDAVYKLFIDKGYSDERIYYLAPDRSHSSKVDATSTRENLQAAIQSWAKSYVGSDRALTLYLMDHGAKDLFYLDKQRSEWVSPDDLSSWLNNLETAIPGLSVNIIIEACFSGSFITSPGSLSKPGRVVVTSTDDNNLAWASQQGAYFSDHLLPALARGDSLYSSYRQAQIAAQISHPNQSAWIDGDGDGNPHDAAEQSAAAHRGFNYPGSFPDLWPPYIAKAEPPLTIEESRGLLRANVRDDDNAVNHVWAVIYPPSYVAPTTGEALVQEALATVTLLVEGNDWYHAYYDGFRESGTYRIVIYADDDQELEARPVEMLVEANGGASVFLPLVVR